MEVGSCLNKLFLVTADYSKVGEHRLLLSGYGAGLASL